MRPVRAIIDGCLVVLNAVETSEEYREGARASGDSLGEFEGYLFEYESLQTLAFENTGVPYNIRILYLLEVTPKEESTRQGVVLDCLDMVEDSCSVTQPMNALYKLAIELRKDFCVKNKIGRGSIVTLYEDEED